MHRQLALLKWAETAAAAASDERSGEAQVTTTGLPQTMSTSVLTAELDKVQLIIDLMQKDQPFHDHNYTSILGRKKFIEVQKVYYQNSTTKLKISHVLMYQLCISGDDSHYFLCNACYY